MTVENASKKSKKNIRNSNGSTPGQATIVSNFAKVGNFVGNQNPLDNSFYDSVEHSQNRQKSNKQRMNSNIVDGTILRN